ncbi:MAG: CidA/LrgA family protein [Treponema sp.]|nr:CidA/LrgA family protein [Treponema sp.]
MKILLQLAFVCAICIAGNAVSSILPFAFPGSIIAMLLLFALFCLRLVKVEQLNPSGKWLQNNMAFFFLPANLMIIEELGLISQVWLQLLLISVVSTIVTFAVAAGAATLAAHIQSRLLHTAVPAGEGEDE